MRQVSIVKFLLLGAVLASTAVAESGYDAWLRYAPLEGTTLREAHRWLPAVVTVINDGSATDVVLGSAQQELIRGVKGMTGRTLRTASGVPQEGAIVVATVDGLRRALPAWNATPSDPLINDGYSIQTLTRDGHRQIVIAGENARGALYGVFALLRKLGTGESVQSIDVRQEPYNPVRWVNHWDNLEGTIERGYGGRSIFWEDVRSREDLSQVNDYGRLLASLGIQATTINNVNVNTRSLELDFLPQIARIADVLRRWGVGTAISVDFGSPQKIGGLDTFDPLDPQVIAWWKAQMDAVYDAVPDLAGVVIKADSEGRVGPSAYGRTHADAANVVARAVASHGGLVFYRGFVYDHHMDWRDPKNDRGRAADDNFRPLDGDFDDNVIVQIKNGPIDFQVREPASPLFGTLEHTNQAIELQITQEYFGQGHHTVYLAPMWKDALDFDMRVGGEYTPVKALVAGKVFHQPVGGIVGVSNVGRDENWLGNHLSQSNLYAFGRLAWNPDLSSEAINREWRLLTFGDDAEVARVVDHIQLSSYPAFENYTGPLGLQTLTDITGNHYGVRVEASERNGWGQWHRADETGIGMDRTVATGTGYIGQYRPEVAARWEALATTPDDLLLFLHHVPYTYRLHSGETVIQHIYDAHYAGAETVQEWVADWESLRGRVDERRYDEILAQLKYQAGQAEVWRDAVNNWFHRETGIDDALGRVGNHPNRTEAEALTLNGYSEVDVDPWEGAGDGKAVECQQQSCSATLSFSGEPGWYTLHVRYFDQNNGSANYRVYVDNQLIDEWTAK